MTSWLRPAFPAFSSPGWSPVVRDASLKDGVLGRTTFLGAILNHTFGAPARPRADTPTRFNIRVDNDELVAAGVPGVQLTWMVTRRPGCVSKRWVPWPNNFSRSYPQPRLRHADTPTRRHALTPIRHHTLTRRPGCVSGRCGPRPNSFSRSVPDRYSFL